MLSDIASIATAVGVAIAVIVYWQDRQRASRQREAEAHALATEQWRDIVKLGIGNPELEKYMLFGVSKGEVTDKEVLFELYGVLMSHVFFLERRHENKTVDESWFIGWKRLFHYLAHDPDFDAYFCKMEKFYDRKFCEWYLGLRADETLEGWYREDRVLVPLRAQVELGADELGGRLPAESR